MYQPEPDYRRYFVAGLLAAIAMTSWMSLVEAPRRQAMARYTLAQEQKAAALHLEQEKNQALKATDSEANPDLTRGQRLALSPRLRILSDNLHGSIDLQGARFDDISLPRYREALEADSPEVTLFSPNGDQDAYFAQIGWTAADASIKTPDTHTLWQADTPTLSPGGTAHLRWDNGQGITYLLTISLDAHYMFSIDQRVENHSGHSVALSPYAYINRAYEIDPAKQKSTVYTRNSGGGLHEGPLGVLNGTLEEDTYKDLHDKGNKSFDVTATSWFGITDKFWLSALIPASGHYKATFSHYEKDGQDRYQVDYLGDSATIAGNASADNQLRLFAGAKEIKLLDQYAAGDPAHNEPPIPLFDRAVDFGMLYFLTKPMAQLLNFFFAISGNVGIAIMMLTIVIKLVLFPFANRSYKLSSRMQQLQPELQKLAQRYPDDKLKLNQEKMALMKREKVNPAAGCLPALIQMPVFFALLRVLNVSIEMRHAPFFGWIRDLSAPDPSNIFTLFGLIHWQPFDWMQLGLLPILYCISMIFYVRLQPPPPDPTSAKTMKLMPYFLMFIFARMPAGLVIYYIWSNLLSVVQQLVMIKRHGGRRPATLPVSPTL